MGGKSETPPALLASFALCDLWPYGSPQAAGSIAQKQVFEGLADSPCTYVFSE